MMNPLTVPVTDQTCPATAYQSASICVPVTVTPFAETGGLRKRCSGART